MWDKYRCINCNDLFKPYYCEKCNTKMFDKCEFCHNGEMLAVWLLKRFGVVEQKYGDIRQV